MKFPNNFRIKEKDGFFIPQEKFLFFWNNIFENKFNSKEEAKEKLILVIKQVTHHYE